MLPHMSSDHLQLLKQLQADTKNAGASAAEDSEPDSEPDGGPKSDPASWLAIIERPPVKITTDIWNSVPSTAWVRQLLGRSAPAFPVHFETVKNKILHKHLSVVDVLKECTDKALHALLDSRVDSGTSATLEEIYAWLYYGGGIQVTVPPLVQGFQGYQIDECSINSRDPCKSTGSIVRMRFEDVAQQAEHE